MLRIHIESFGNLSIVQCGGRIVRSDAAFSIREAVTSQQSARIVVLDLSEVSAIEGGGLGMLWFLQRWTRDHGIRLKLFNPTNSVRDSLLRANSMIPFDIASCDEMMALVALAESRPRRAA